MASLRAWGRRFWKWFQRFGQIVGDFIGRLILTLFYFTVLLPFGIGVRLFADPLEVDPDGESGWREHGPTDRTLEEGRRQY